MVSMYRREKDEKKIEPIPVLTVIVVVCVCLFIAVDSTVHGGQSEGDRYILRIELRSDVHTNLNGILTFETNVGTFEKLTMEHGLPGFTNKSYRGTYLMSFEGEETDFNPIEITVVGLGRVYKESINDIVIQVDALEG